VNHHTFNRIKQPDAANSQVYYLLFKYSSTFIIQINQPTRCINLSDLLPVV